MRKQNASQATLFSSGRVPRALVGLNQIDSDALLVALKKQKNAMGQAGPRKPNSLPFKNIVPLLSPLH